jgi:hypothetical protein
MGHGYAGCTRTRSQILGSNSGELMKKLFALLAVLFLSVGSAFAQATTGDIVGTVTDGSGALVPSASVIAKNVNTGVSYPATGTGTGEFRISNVLSGTYNITVAAPGFTTNELKDFVVDVNKTSTANFKLLAGTITSVEVTEEAAVALDTTTSQLQETFTAKEMSDLPIAATSLLNLSFLSPGVSSTGGLGEGTGPSISGQRARDNSFTVEGTDNNNKTVTGNVVNVQNEAAHEFTLLENVFDAEYGHSNGGQFNVALKTGTNKYHGSLFEYFQNRNLNALDNSQLLAGITSQPRYDNNRFGGNLGGPIVKDKLFFFFDYEQNPIGTAGGSGSFCAPTAAGYATLAQYRAGTNLTVLQKYLPAVSGADPSGICNTYTYVDSAGASHSYADTITLTAAGAAGAVGPNGDQVLIPVGAASAPAPSFQNGRYISASADYNPTSKDNIRFRYAYDRQDGIDTAASLPIFFAPSPFRGTIGSLTYVHTFTSNLFNEARIGFNRAYGPLDTAPGVFPGLASFPNLDLDDLGISLGPDGNAPQGGAQNFYQFVDNVTFVKAHHTFKFGFDGRKYIAYTDFVQRSRGEYEYSNTSDVYLQDLSPDVFGQRNASGAISTRYYGDQTAFYGYAQDDWRVTPKLTLNYGLRYEFTSVPAGEKAQQLNSAANDPGLILFNKPQPYKTAFAPRFGFAYAPNTSTSVRGGFAIGYDVLFDNIGTTLAPPQQQVTENVDTSVSTPDFLKDGGLAAQAPSTYPSLAAQRAASTHYIPNQTLPYTESYSIGIQHVFHSDYTAEVRYVGDHSVHLDTQQQINVFSPVTAAFNLPTVIGAPTAADLASTLSLTNIKAVAAGTGHIIPAYAAAGFVNAITGYLSQGHSNYNGLQTQLQRRFKHGLLFNTAYTWSKTMDNSTDDFNSTSLNPRRAQDQTDYSAENSLSALSHKHRFTAEIVYDLPFFKQSNFLMRNLAGNWELAPIYTYESGQFVTPQAGLDANLNGDSAGDRASINPLGKKNVGSGVTPFYNPALTATLCPDPTQGCSASLVGYSANNPDAYYVATASGAHATAARNMLPTPAINDLDLSALKRISFTQRYSFEFEAIAYNVVNHPQFTDGVINNVGGESTVGAALQAYAIPGKTQFLNPQSVFGSNSRSMILVARFKF